MILTYNNQQQEKEESVDNGRLYVADPVFSIDCGGLDTTFLSHLLLNVKRFVMQPFYTG